MASPSSLPPPPPSSPPSRQQPDASEPLLSFVKLMPEPLRFIGFRIERADARCVEGRFVVSQRSCQPFGVLHGGMSAFIAESLASSGSHIASGFQRVAGVELQINHLKAVPIGLEVFASAKPLHLGRTLHVWDVNFSSVGTPVAPDAETTTESKLIAVARVTLMVGLSEKDNSQSSRTVSRL